VVCSTCTIKPTTGCDVLSRRQYHIQTDEGPERYFRYQTASGQYRKEKRLEDGTVIGTYAWIDDNGVLRQRDYIADNAGYRILKTNNLYVGHNVPIGDAVKATKKYSVIAGTSDQKSVETIPFMTDLPSNSYKPSTLQYTTSSPTTVANQYKSLNSILSTSPPGVLTSTMSSVVKITPKSIYSTTHSLVSLPNNCTSIKYDIGNHLLSGSNPIDYTTELLSGYQSTPNPLTEYTSAPPNLQYVPSTYLAYHTPALYTDYIDAPKKTKQNHNYHLLKNKYRFRNGPTYPLDQNGKFFIGQDVRKQYDQRYQPYDDLSIVTNDGFRYYIPRAYHEEQTLPEDKRSGSFGYIDPFGIRRVIYYNTAPGTGFQHRKK
ncbi:hypothetical protein NQ314_014518, partial [Rhamnusium bicolor]